MKSRPEYRICKKCVMDTTDPDIIFDEHGVCNHCKTAEEIISKIPKTNKEDRLEKLVSRIKEDGKDGDYDCVIGLSGGVDSSYVAYWVHKLGLRPLAIHLDNGWNTELAVKNIENIVKKLSFDLYTYVIDWEEFKDVQLSFMKASVVDIEMATDNAIFVTINKIAKEKGIKYFLSGTNIASESIMPRSWYFYAKYDSLNIKSIHKKFGRIKKIISYPTLNFFEYWKYRFFDTVKIINFLDYVEYNKEEAKKVLQKELDWRDYGGKHYESKFTEFYQSYILPTKFNIDKRKAFLSSLIVSNQMSREEALEILKNKLYDSHRLKEDKEYVIKKFNISPEDFDELMSMPPKSHFDYPTYEAYNERLGGLKKVIKKILGKRN